MRANFKICRPNNSIFYSAPKYLENLNQDQSYRSVKIEKSRRVVESRPVCLDLEASQNSHVTVFGSIQFVFRKSGVLRTVNGAASSTHA